MLVKMIVELKRYWIRGRIKLVLVINFIEGRVNILIKVIIDSKKVEL